MPGRTGGTLTGDACPARFGNKLPAKRYVQIITLHFRMPHDMQLILCLRLQGRTSLGVTLRPERQGGNQETASKGGLARMSTIDVRDPGGLRKHHTSNTPKATLSFYEQATQQSPDQIPKLEVKPRQSLHAWATSTRWNQIGSCGGSPSASI